MDWLPGLLTVLAIVATPLPLASARSNVEASLECVCKSTHFDGVHFALKCQRTIENSVEAACACKEPTLYPAQDNGVDFQERSAVSCRREPPPPPTDDYKLVPGLGYYKLHTELKNWGGALVACTREGASLARIRSKQEEEHLAGLLRPYPKLAPEGWRNAQAWLGFSDLDKEGVFVAPDGTTLDSLLYANWQEGDPNNLNNNEHCLAMLRNGQINDNPCEAEMAFFCFRKA